MLNCLVWNSSPALRSKGLEGLLLFHLFLAPSKKNGSLSSHRLFRSLHEEETEMVKCLLIKYGEGLSKKGITGLGKQKENLCFPGWWFLKFVKVFRKIS